jgi:hypothetical protein
VIKSPRTRKRDCTTTPTTTTTMMKLQFCVLGLVVGIIVRLVEIVACFLIAAGWSDSSHVASRVLLLVLSQLSIAVCLPMLIVAVQMIRNKQKVQRHWPTKKCHVCCEHKDAVVVDGSHFPSKSTEEQSKFYCILSLLSGMSIGSYLTWATIDDILAGGGQPTHSSDSFLASCVIDWMMFSVLVWLYQVDRPESTNREIMYAEQEQAAVEIV